MSLRSAILRLYARRIARSTSQDRKLAIEHQHKWLKQLLSQGVSTQFGKHEGLSTKMDARTYAENIPIRDYEKLRPYVDQILEGQPDVLWKGRPKYLAKTSGTTSGVKYIPVSHESIKYHINTARKSIFNYLHMTGKPIFDGKVMFLSGSPTLTEVGGIPTGRLSGIVNHEIPGWLKPGQLPSPTTNKIEDWEKKLEKIVEETWDKDMRLISGIPPWVQMYYERLLEKTGKENIMEVFPNLSLFCYGGVNYEPYRSTMDKLHGVSMDAVETYPASEGFIAYQDDYREPGLLLNTNAGMYFEFVPLEEAGHLQPTRLTLEQVEVGKDYSLIMTTNAGLWTYEIGDTIRFISLDPFRIRVSGRVKHFISAFGEHVIAKEIEEAMRLVSQKHGLLITEFSVAPQVLPPEGGLPYHEWHIEFQEHSVPIPQIAQDLDKEICRQNIYYDDLIKGKVIRPLKIRQVVSGGFRSYMRGQGRLGGQNKVPRLLNDRKMVELLEHVSP